MYKLLKSIKYQGQYYQAGDVIEVKEENIEEFIIKKIISGVTEKTDDENAPNSEVNDDSNAIASEELKESKTGEETSKSEYDSLSIEDLKATLDAKGISYKSSARKGELIKLLNEVE